MERIKNLYKNLSPTVRASFWFVVCNVIQKATQILTTPIYTRLMSQAEYGEYTVFLSWVEVAAIFATLDIFYSGYNVGMEKFRDDRANYTTSMHGLVLLITAFFFIIVFLASEKLSKLAGISALQIKLLAGYMFIFPIFQFWSARKKYDYEYKPLILVTAIISVGTIITGTLFAQLFNVKSDGVIIAKICIEGLASIPLLIISIKGVKNLYNKYYWKYALKFNIPLIPHYLSTMILNHSDRLMIVAICDSASAAMYSVAYSVAMLITIVQNAINSAIVPWLYKRIRTEKYEGVSKAMTMVVTIVALLNLMLLMIAPEAVKILSTKEYYNAVAVIPPITYGVFLTALYGLFVNIEFYFNFNKFAAVASFVAAALNVVLNYIFINLYGYVAAAYTTFACYLVLAVMHYIGLRIVCIKNSLKLSKVFNFKAIASIIIIFTAGCVLFSLMYNMPLIRYLLIVLLVFGILLVRNKIFAYIRNLKNE